MVRWWGQAIQQYLTTRVWIPVRRDGPFNGFGLISLKLGLTAHKPIVERIRGNLVPVEGIEPTRLLLDTGF
jgi:hypothetical protein